MTIISFPAGPLQANCYVVAPDDGTECIVIDTGQQASEPLRAVLAERGLRPAAIFLTHGHFDHVASAADVSREYGADVYLGGADIPMLEDPASALSEELRAQLPQFLAPGESLTGLRPSRLTALVGRETIRVAGLDVAVLPVPGHTPGSMTYRLSRGDGQPDVLFTGDTLFASTIGRTDLPGGSAERIIRSIAAEILPLPDETVVLPGHGPATTVGAERRFNPFLREPRAR